jgi:hypothetical protein
MHSKRAAEMLTNPWIPLRRRFAGFFLFGLTARFQLTNPPYGYQGYRI